MAAAALPTTETVSNNERLFIRYAQVFRQVEPNVPEYINRATRFAAWLRDSKAYYDLARPYIVKLLLFAQVSLRQALGVSHELTTPFKATDYYNHPSLSAMVKAYIDLVESIRPFQSLFSSDTPLYAHVQGLLGTVTPAEKEGTSAPLVNQTTDSKVGPMLSEASTPSQQIQSSTTSSIANPPPNTTATVVKAKKKRKNIDFKLLVQHDLKGLMQKKEIQQSSHLGTPSISNTPILQSHITQEKAGNENNTTSAELQDDEQSRPSLPSTDKGDTDALAPLTGQEVGSTDHEHLQHNTQPGSQEAPEVSNRQSPVPSETMDVRTSSTTHSVGTPAMSDVSPQNKEGSPMDVGWDSTVTPSASEDRLLEPTTTLLPGSPTAIDPTDLSDPQTNVSRGPISVGIVAQHTGQPQSSRISIQFNITSEQFHLLSNWNNRTSEHVTCLTLGCYVKSSTEDNKLTEDITLENSLTSRHSVWPPHGSLSMSVNFNNKRETLSLSPPFQVTPENLVDVSPFAVLGQNVIELIQSQDLSQYTFILREHYPSQAQLAHIEKQTKKKKSWDEWVIKVSQDFDIPLPLKDKFT